MTYVDSNIFIYLFENHPVFGKLAANQLARLRQDSSLICSVLTVTECLAQVTNISLDTFHALPDLRLIAIDERIAVKAADLQQSTTMRIGDAIHLAAALEHGAELFLTNDKQLAKIAKRYISVLLLSSLSDKDIDV